jgi:dTDP-4-dehydrorhamnose 3,5-epimerase-like enzyme
MNVATAIKFPRYIDPNGDLCVYECGRQVPFGVQRVFTVSAVSGDMRGDHAHKQCTQLLVCVSGCIKVYCDNGAVETCHRLDSMHVGLLIPPGIWAREEYLTDGAVLMVLCNQNYDENDYIRDYEVFKTYFAL